jgi:hypothetical protein
MIVGIAVETTVDSNDARAVTRRSAKVTALRRFGSNRGGGGVTRLQPSSAPTRRMSVSATFGPAARRA